MSEQENQNSIQCSDGFARKEWKKPTIVELSEVNGEGAKGKIFYSRGESGTILAPS